MSYSSVSGGYWRPLGARSVYGAPNVGDVVAFDHQAWRVVEVRDLPTGEHTDDDRAARRFRQKPPVAVRLRPTQLADHPDPVKARSGDKHYVAQPYVAWSVFPDSEHYPLCACCAEPMPCRAEVGRATAEKAIADLGRYETSGVCPACEEVVTARQKKIVFAENLTIPGGPPVTFHLRGRCMDAAVAYDKRWAAADPATRRPSLSCTGHLTNHNNGTYDCTEMASCSGPTVRHPSYSVCACPECHAQPWTWGRGCHPHSAARLNTREEP